MLLTHLCETGVLAALFQHCRVDCDDKEKVGNGTRSHDPGTTENKVDVNVH
jgi:hypothetical protein